MAPLWALLMALCWRYAVGGSAVTLRSTLFSPYVFSFENLPAGSGTLAVSGNVRALHGVRECACRQRCLTEPTCHGYGYSDNMATCRLTELLPTPQRMEKSSEDWRWHARNGVRLLDEPCAADWDCSLLVPAATCVKNVCGCHSPVEKDGAGRCRKAGSFIEVSGHQLTSGLLSETPGMTVDACNASCAGNISCVAFDFAAEEGRCRMYAEGVTSDVSPSGGVQSFVWRFARPDGTPPDAYQQVGGSYLRMLSQATALEATFGCFTDGAILFPGVTEKELAPLQDFFATQKAPSHVLVGLSDLLQEALYITSDNRTPSDIAWDQGEGDEDEHCAVIRTANLRIHDVACGRAFPALCQFVGENLALRRLSWMNAHHPANPAGYGNDGDQETLVHPPDAPHLHRYTEITWTVDLGGPVQVSSVLYLARTSCCDPPDNRNRLTEIRVGSGPDMFDEQHSARCVWLEQPFVARASGRLFRCAVPLTGRYVRLIRDKRQPLLDFAELAVFGNRLWKH